MEKINILSYSSELKEHFKTLNEEWLNKHFYVEPVDEKVLGDPDTYIIHPGGDIIYAECDGQIVGTVALKLHEPEVFELTKMGVTEAFQGKRVGDLLMREALIRAKELGGKKVILYSNRKLAPAINLYRKTGFTEIDVESGKYERCDIKMEYPLNPDVDMRQIYERIESYGRTFEKLTHVLSQMPKEMWKWKPAPDRWSIHENIIHLADSEVNSYIRCRRFIAEPGSTVMAYDQDRWAGKLDYHRRSAEDALEMFRLLKKMSYDLIRTQPESVWSNTIVHPENGVMSFTDWLRIYEDHNHIGQIERTYEEWKAAQNLQKNI
jgi:GNAT superfamily N-acetyltransferase